MNRQRCVGGHLNPRIREVEAGELLQVWSHPKLHREFQVNQSYRARLYLKKTSSKWKYSNCEPAQLDRLNGRMETEENQRRREFHGDLWHGRWERWRRRSKIGMSNGWKLNLMKDIKLEGSRCSWTPCGINSKGCTEHLPSQHRGPKARGFEFEATSGYVARPCLTQTPIRMHPPQTADH